MKYKLLFKAIITTVGTVLMLLFFLGMIFAIIALFGPQGIAAVIFIIAIVIAIVLRYNYLIGMETINIIDRTDKK